MEEKGYSTTGKNTQTLGICTISKDSFQISTLVCSTKLTQNGNSCYILMNICLFSCASCFFKLKKSCLCLNHAIHIYIFYPLLISVFHLIDLH